MEEWVFIVVLVLGVPIVLAAWLIVRVIKAGSRLEELSRRLGELELEVFRLKGERDSGQPAAPTATPAAPPAAPEREEILRRLHERAPTTPFVKSAPAEIPVAAPQIETVPPPVLPPPPPSIGTGRPPMPEPQGVPVPAIDWEKFMGVKLFAWIGGLALFLGIAFFVKYSFDNNFVPPELRVAIGFVIGLGLVVGGVILSRRDYAVLSQTLCATGVVILYAVTFSCRSIYHFEFFGPIPTFLLMILITTTAFLLAVRLNALVVAILGMLGGFLTPVLLSTGQDNPLGLFGYIAILDAGLIVVALHRRWFFLTALGAAGTAVLQIGWAEKFFVAERYFDGSKILIALAVLLGFSLLHLGAAWQAKRRRQTNGWLTGSVLGLVGVALAFTVWFLDFEPLAHRPWLLFGFVFLVDLVVAALVRFDDRVFPAHSVAGLAVFGLLGLWTTQTLTSEWLNAALAFYLVFSVLHSVFPILEQRRRGAAARAWGSQAFPPLALVLVLVPIFKLADLSFLVWPFILLVDLLAIGLAVATASILSVLAVLALTLAATGLLIFKIPATLTGLPTSFVLLGAFAVFFVAAGVWLARRFRPDRLRSGNQTGPDPAVTETMAALLPASSTVLPFLLLMMATTRLPLADPSPVFGLALLLVVLLLGVTKLFSLDWMPAIGLTCVAALECTWHFSRFTAGSASQALTWYLVFFAVFALFPFLFLRQFAGRAVPWAVAALAGLPQFLLIYRVVLGAWPNGQMGLLPAAFAIPGLLSLGVVLKKIPESNPVRLTQLAWFGGVALFFVTLIFPIQFERQWITIGWALEGAALLWLFHRVPHPGLRLTGLGLLAAAFGRLAFNPAVLEYHARSATPILNWYLYAYGIVAVCLFAGARLLSPPRNRVAGVNAPPFLTGLGAVLSFLLLNIEIADYFSAEGTILTFQFSGDFARDMTYSIAWALFALVLLVTGILKRAPASRYAGLGLLSVTVIKLFFHDLARLDQLFRIGAFIGVAVIAMLASFAYQRFYTAALKDKDKESKNEAAG